ncbi:hypothetical protein D3C74_477040 [compost metagenome]
MLEAGTYKLYAGTSVKQAVPVGFEGKEGYVLEELEVVEQLQEALAPSESFTRMMPGARRADGSYELTYVEAPKQKISLAKRI